MKDFNSYLDNLDYSLVKDLFHEKGKQRIYHIQAITECSVYEISRHDIIEYWETDMKTQRFGRHVAESLFEMVYERLLDSYCTPEIRYRNLMERCPNLKEVVPLKSIASFLGVTPETISRIRRKLEI